MTTTRRIEARSSAELYVARTNERHTTSSRNLLRDRKLVFSPEAAFNEGRSERWSQRPRHQHLPLDGTEHGMMIDAGSQGTRIHVYEFEARILSRKIDIDEVVAGRKLSIPTTDTRWTNRLKPGLDSFAYIDNEEHMILRITEYLEPLIRFAEDVLREKKGRWKNFPIYLKATGGMRTLPRPYRIRLIAVVRKIMHNKRFNPFFFENE
jgi:GDA1/CD39 (nucleoside phosphatase) family